MLVSFSSVASSNSIPIGLLWFAQLNRQGFSHCVRPMCLSSVALPTLLTFVGADAIRVWGSIDLLCLYKLYMLCESKIHMDIHKRERQENASRQNKDQVRSWDKMKQDRSIDVTPVVLIFLNGVHESRRWLRKVSFARERVLNTRTTFDRSSTLFVSYLSGWNT